MSPVITHTVDLTVIDCSECGVTFALDESYRKRCEKDSKKTFYCTNGHPQHYPQQAEKMQRLERDLANTRETLRIRNAELVTERDQHRATKGQLTKTKKKVARAEKGVCTICRRSFANVRDHMLSKHAGSEEAARVAAEHRHEEHDMGSKAKSHWENWRLDDLRKLARTEYGITNVKKYKKKQLIHEMRVRAHAEDE